MASEVFRVLGSAMTLQVVRRRGEQPPRLGQAANGDLRVRFDPTRANGHVDAVLDDVEIAVRRDDLDADSWVPFAEGGKERCQMQKAEGERRLDTKEPDWIARGLADARFRFFHAAEDVAAALAEDLALAGEGELSGGSMNETDVEPLLEHHQVSAGCRHRHSERLGRPADAAGVGDLHEDLDLGPSIH